VARPDGSRSPHQLSLAGVPTPRPSGGRRIEPPEGFRHAEDFLDRDAERDLLEKIRPLPFKEFEFHGYLGRRRVVSFGWSYRYDERRLQAAPPIPPFLLALRERAAVFAGLPPESFAQSLVAEYRPGAPIGWHRDKPEFEDVVGVSLLSACRLRFRRKSESGWERWTHEAEPRSIYLLRGDVRNRWEHSIPPVASLRYSITFRSLRDRGAPPRAA